MRRERLFERLSAMGAAAQSAVPGIYAWGVTVAPAAWSHGSSRLTKAVAVVALLVPVAGIVCEGRWGVRARVASFWGFVLASAATWSLAPVGLSMARIDAPSGLAGMFGWGLFAFVSAAPVLTARSVGEAPVDGSLLVPRRTVPTGNSTYVAVGGLMAALLQTVGWTVASPERGLLLRFISLAAGLSLLGGATQLALACHLPRAVSTGARRFRRAMVAIVALGILILSGLLFAVRA